MTEFDDEIGCGCGCLLGIAFATAAVILLTGFLVAMGWFFDAWDALGAG